MVYLLALRGAGLHRVNPGPFLFCPPAESRATSSDKCIEVRRAPRFVRNFLSTLPRTPDRSLALQLNFFTQIFHSGERLPFLMDVVYLYERYSGACVLSPYHSRVGAGGERGDNR